MSAWTGPHARVSGHDTIAGDVYSIQESVYTAAFQILLMSNIADQDVLRRVRIAARRLRGRPKATKKTRPCIVMEDGSRMVCITASWDKTPLSTLPEVFQFFSFPIYRNHCDKSAHCHSLPDWGIEAGFVFAWQFESQRPFINRWPKQEVGDTPEQPYVFGEIAWSRIQEACIAKKAEWIAKCRTDPNFAVKCALECLDHKQNECDNASYAGSVASFNSGYTVKSAAFSMRSGISVASGRSRMSFVSGEKRPGGGADSDYWRKPRDPGTGNEPVGSNSDNWRENTEAGTGSESYPSLAAAAKLLHDGVSEPYLACRPTSDTSLRQFIQSRSKAQRTLAKDDDKSSMRSATSNRFAALNFVPSRRGSRDH
ncbi:hypothetical protein C8T65DRAFT_761699 [Cerioporus squamosus]|nr:hypothetical protein C8T65DRAFT_761699 [Cerioporus squamosus]